MNITIAPVTGRLAASTTRTENGWGGISLMTFSSPLPLRTMTFSPAC